MAYSLVGLIAIAVHLIINFDVILDMKGNGKFRGEKYYLFFLLSVIAFHIADGIWGFLNDAKLSTGLFIDTTIYFVTMAASILLWGIFLHHYLGFEKKNSKIILYTSFAIFAFQIAIIIANFFSPILFSVSEDCVYSAGPVRYVNLCVQVIMYLLLSVYTLFESRKVTGSEKRKHITIAMFGIFLMAAITFQVFFPLLPLYSLGYLLGICVLHTFVFRNMLANSQQKLEETKQQVFMDALTGVYSKHAYIDLEAKIDDKITSNLMEKFALVVFDLNDLKSINDNYGHEAGDNYLVDSTKLIKETFRDIPLYRVGGDEFVAILRGENFENKDQLIKTFEKRIDENLEKKDRLIISSGLAVFDKEKDTTILKVFTRADREMYARKQILKSRQK